MITSALQFFLIYTLTQNKNFCTFIMGFTLYENKTPIPPNARGGIQACVRVLTFISWGVSENHRIFQI